jgi:hypothetical protein
MSLPRAVIPGRCYLVTRRCSEQYRDARNEKLAGRDVVFPAGTWWLHRFAGVRRAEPEATAPPA